MQTANESMIDERWKYRIYNSHRLFLTSQYKVTVFLTVVSKAFDFTTHQLTFERLFCLHRLPLLQSLYLPQILLQKQIITGCHTSSVALKFPVCFG